MSIRVPFCLFFILCALSAPSGLSSSHISSGEMSSGIPEITPLFGGAGDHGEVLTLMPAKTVRDSTFLNCFASVHVIKSPLPRGLIDFRLPKFLCNSLDTVMGFTLERDFSGKIGLMKIDSVVVTNSDEEDSVA